MTAPEDCKEVQPVNTKRQDGETYRDKYTFGSVFIDEIPEDFNQKGVDFENGINRVRWEYSGKCPILICRDRVLAKENAPTEEAQNQAYFALSILADEGMVSGFSKVM